MGALGNDLSCQHGGASPESNYVNSWYSSLVYVVSIFFSIFLLFLLFIYGVFSQAYNSVHNQFCVRVLSKTISRNKLLLKLPRSQHIVQTYYYIISFMQMAKMPFFFFVENRKHALIKSKTT